MSLSLSDILTLPPEKKVDNYCFNYQAFLGKGSFSNVYAGFDENNGNIVAIKVINNRLLLDDYISKSLQAEIAIMQKLSHPNLVKFYNMLTTVNNAYVITEYCNGGDLGDLVNNKKRLTEPEALLIMSDVLRGMRELVKNKIIHRDLKPANIFINDGVFKIGDFGFAKQMQDWPERTYNPIVGTPYYMPPKYLQTGQFTIKHDIWAIGVMFYEILCGDTPWPSSDKTHLLHNIYSKPLFFPNHIEISPLCQNFIRRCLEINEDKRISWEEIFKSELFFMGNSSPSSIGGLQKMPSFKKIENEVPMEIEKKGYEENINKPSTIFLENSSTNCDTSKKETMTNQSDSPLDKKILEDNIDFLNVNHFEKENNFKMYNFSKNKGFMRNQKKLESLIDYMDFLNFLREMIEKYLSYQKLVYLEKMHYIFIKHALMIGFFLSENENDNVLGLEDWKVYKKTYNFTKMIKNIQQINENLFPLFANLGENPKIFDFSKNDPKFFKLYNNSLGDENQDFFLLADYFAAVCLNEINDVLKLSIQVGRKSPFKEEEEILVKILDGLIEYHKTLVFFMKFKENKEEIDYSVFGKKFDFFGMRWKIINKNVDWLSYLELKMKVYEINP